MRCALCGTNLGVRDAAPSASSTPLLCPFCEDETVAGEHQGALLRRRHDGHPSILANSAYQTATPVVAGVLERVRT
jgi:hypothetical protein